MKLLTFLGTGNYQATTYVFGAQDCVTRFFPVAAAQFVQPVQTLVCVTPTVEKHANWAELGQQLNERGVTYQAVPIPEGHSEANLWEIFDRLTEVVDEAEEVTFDVTHSFRSLPILSLLAMAYLKAAKQVKVKQVLYGAWEAHDDQNRSPVFDLTPFVALLDWLSATDQFVQTGNARTLSGLLNPKKLQQGTLFGAANILDTISQAARLCQPFTLMQEVGGLERALTNAQRELQISAPPFGVLRNQIVRAYAQFQNDGRDVAEMLRTEFHLVEWYYQKGQTIQAITLAREWLIDAVTYRLGQTLDFLIDNRKPFEDAIAGVALIGKQHPQERDRNFTENDLNRFGLELLKWPEIEALKQLWTDLKNVRNPLDHAEHQRKKDKEKTLGALNKLQAKIEEKVMPGLRELAAKWGLA